MLTAIRNMPEDVIHDEEESTEKRQYSLRGGGAEYQRDALDATADREAEKFPGPPCGRHQRVLGKHGIFVFSRGVVRSLDSGKPRMVRAGRTFSFRSVSVRTAHDDRITRSDFSVHVRTHQPEPSRRTVGPAGRPGCANRSGRGV